MNPMCDFLLEETEYNPELNKTYEGLMAQGNGYLHIRGSFEEGLLDAPQNEEYMRTMKSVTTEVQQHPLSKCGTYLPLIMGKHPALEEVILNLPFFMDISLWADGEKMDMIHSKIRNYRRVLNMKNGHLTRSFVFETKKGCCLELTWERFASMARRHLFAQRVSCRVLSGAAELEWKSGINADITTNGRCHFQKTELNEEDGAISCLVTTDLDFQVLMKSALLFHHGNPEGTTEWEEKRIYRTWHNRVTAGDEFSFCKFTVCGCSRDLEGSFTDTVNMELENAKKSIYDALLVESADEWEKLWNNADVQIDGDEELQKGLRFSIYHLLRSNTGFDNRVQVCAKGFAGEAYYGRYFWDSEIYLLPFYLYTNPKAARSLVMYRYCTLDGARKNAARYHCRGARYPWQSGLTGEEQCSLWEYADNEVHITADVAFAVMHYYRATQDYDFLRDEGLEILLETARFWIDRIDWGADGICHLLNVMGPDEYSPMTCDNGYTNRMVKFNLESAVEMARLVRKESPESYNSLMRKIGFSEGELDLFQHSAASLPIPYDVKRDLYLQSADFEEYADIDINALWKDRSRPFGFFATQEKIYRSKCIKQADTIALMTLFPHEFTDSQVKTAYNYYKPMTTHDSSLSPAGHTIAANRIGCEEDVEQFLRQTLDVDLSPEKKGAEDGIHIANCGCLWQLAVNSFAGLDPASCADGLTLKPNLPKNISRISFRIFWHGEQRRVTVTRKSVKVE